MRTLIDTDSTPDAQGFGDVRFAGFFVHHDAFLPVSYRWTIVETLVVAFLWLTIVFFENCNAHSLTSFFPRRHHQ